MWRPTSLFTSFARATENPHYERLLGFLEQYQREAMSVPRTNEALDSGYIVEVRGEHPRSPRP